MSEPFRLKPWYKTDKEVAMPKEMEKALRAQARKKWPKDKKKQDAYVYAAMRARGWKPKSEKK